MFSGNLFGPVCTPAQLIRSRIQLIPAKAASRAKRSCLTGSLCANQDVAESTHTGESCSTGSVSRASTAAVVQSAISPAAFKYSIRYQPIPSPTTFTNDFESDFLSLIEPCRITVLRSSSTRQRIAPAKVPLGSSMFTSSPSKNTLPGWSGAAVGMFLVMVCRDCPRLAGDSLCFANSGTFSWPRHAGKTGTKNTRHKAVRDINNKHLAFCFIILTASLINFFPSKTL